MITVPLKEIWIVHARSGRMDGSAYVRAKTKKEANDFAQNGGWLEFGRVTKSETKTLMKWYEVNEGITDVANLYGNFLSDADVAAINGLTEGKWHEIEWGC
jgi:hypothetical protein